MTRPGDIARAFGCPLRIAATMLLDDWCCPATLRAVRRVGPVRMRWLGNAGTNVGEWSAWSLDGKRASFPDIMAAAEQ